MLTIFSSDNSDLVSGHRNTAVPLHVVFLLVAFVVSVGAQGGYYLSGRILVALLVTAGALVAIMSRPRLPGDVRMVLLAGAVLSAWALIRGGAARTSRTSGACPERSVRVRTSRRPAAGWQG